ncbi:hypothetical protein C475_17988 [Halosimplex carlsbadense 2-9-1]|uniref:Uncharacterized protein n=1 Tax=Halosimplex carlsbadense 2-9-1 TaxID=797114 RepID=M0CIG5_9EURY|nr:hypothetical protein [Halosimplex carlsbadense]ELZ22428.1 hypothetical protein C475_17988 [Halosimplex carlsbadense 2-9-1]
MVDSGIRRWSFTRDYEVGGGPWPTEDEATVAYDDEETTVTVSGVFFDGGSNHEGCARRVSYAPNERRLAVDVGTVSTGEEFVMDLVQRIHYEVEVVFAGELPAVTEVRHVSALGNEQFATTLEQSEA